MYCDYFYEKITVLSYILISNFSNYLKEYTIYNISNIALHLSLFLYLRSILSTKKSTNNNSTELFYVETNEIKNDSHFETSRGTVISSSYQIKSLGTYLISISLDDITFYYLIEKNVILEVKDGMKHLKNGWYLFVEDSCLKFRVKSENDLFVYLCVTQID